MAYIKSFCLITLPIRHKKFDFYFGMVYNRFRDKTVNLIAISFSVFRSLKLQDSGGYGHGKITRRGYRL